MYAHFAGEDFLCIFIFTIVFIHNPFLPIIFHLKWFYFMLSTW